MRRLAVAVIALLGLLGTVAGSPAPSGAAPAGAAVEGSGAIPGRFIVTLHDGADPRGVSEEYRRRGDATVDVVYTAALNGFAGAMSDGAVARARADGRVKRVEPDGVVTASAIQTNATWGLDRIDQRDRPLNGTYSYVTAGSGVHAYVVDTGILLRHTEFTGRMGNGFDAVTSGGTANDCNGHGTHVAGTIGGTVHGVAKAVTLHPVRVLGCSGSGTWSGVIAGLDWVTANHVKPAVANMSLGGGANASVDDAVNRTIGSGVAVAVAAGNDGRNACNYSPARVPAALTVGATTSSDARASYSNTGSCLDLFAPGSSITSAWHTSTTAINTISGTSMASPHVAGVAALLLEGSPGASPATVASTIVNEATTGKVTSAGTGSPNRLLFSRIAVAPADNAPPVAAFTHSCSGLTCSFTDTSTDTDGTISRRSWTFGDGGTSTAANPSRTYAAGGTYTVTLTVTDDAGATGTTNQSVTVGAPTGNVTLTVAGYKVQGNQRADLQWSGAAGTSVAVFRDNVIVATPANSGAYTDVINKKGGGSYTYRVCEVGTSTCSPNVTVTF